jgi:hypothetical protein
VHGISGTCIQHMASAWHMKQSQVVRYMSRPPLTPQTWPVMYADASAAREVDHACNLFGTAQPADRNLRPDLVQHLLRDVLQHLGRHETGGHRRIRPGDVAQRGATAGSAALNATGLVDCSNAVETVRGQPRSGGSPRWLCLVPAKRDDVFGAAGSCFRWAQGPVLKWGAGRGEP